VGSFANLYRYRKSMEGRVFRLVGLSIFLTIGSELAFTFYVSVYGFSNLAGHYFKFISFYLIYRALIETGLQKPYNLLFWDLKKREQSYRNLAENIPGVVYRLNLEEGTREFFNTMLEPITGYREGEIEYGGLLVLGPIILSQDKEKALSSVKEALENGKPFVTEYSIRHKNGEIHHLRELGRPDEEGRRHIDGIIMDITEHRRAEVRVKELQKVDSTILEASPVAFLLFDRELRVVRASKAYEEIGGYPLEKVLGKSPREYMLPGKRRDRIVERLRKAREGMKVGPTEVEPSPKSGRYIRETMVPVQEAEGKISHVLVVLSDITDYKEAEEETRLYAKELKEANRLKDLFADILRHDLINPLGIAGNYVDLILEEEENEGKREDLERVKKNLAKAEKIMENARRYSRLESMESLEKEVLELNPLVEEVVVAHSPLAEREGMEIENRVEEGLFVRANPIIEDVFSNLISNALKYASQGRRVIVEAEKVDQSVMVKVVDFGQGIKDEDKEEVFNRFQRRRKKGVKGTGLGLAIARKITELHSGKVWVEDTPGGGATFVVELPGE